MVVSMRSIWSFFALLFIQAYAYRKFNIRKISSNRRSGILSAQKYDPASFIKVSLMKPLGLSLEEVVENGRSGVLVEDVGDGNAKTCGKLYKGLFLVSAGGVDLKNEDFDTILDILRNSPESEPVELEFVDLRNVYRGPAVLTIKMPNGRTILLNSLKGQPMLEVLMSAKVEVYGDRSKLTNCGGSGQCGTCAVLVEDALDWVERPEMEVLRLKKYPQSARLSCKTIIEGDCTVVISPVKGEIRSTAQSV